MPFQPGAMVYTQAFGSRPENVEVPHLDVRAPTTADSNYPVGKRWIDSVGNNEYTLTSFSTSLGITTANWATLGSASGTFNALTATTTVTAGTGITATTGNITATTGNFVASAAGAGLVLNS